jgi:hypothetical protein
LPSESNVRYWFPALRGTTAQGGSSGTKGESGMADAAGGSSRRAELERKLIQRSLEDEEFRRRLLDDPKGAVEQEIGTQLPQEIKIRVVEESPDTIYLVLPPGASPVGRGGEIPDRDLESVAGGYAMDTVQDNTCITVCGHWDCV